MEVTLISFNIAMISLFFISESSFRSEVLMHLPLAGSWIEDDINTNNINEGTIKLGNKRTNERISFEIKNFYKLSHAT